MGFLRHPSMTLQTGKKLFQLLLNSLMLAKVSLSFTVIMDASDSTLSCGIQYVNECHK